MKRQIVLLVAAMLALTGCSASEESNDADSGLSPAQEQECFTTMSNAADVPVGENNDDLLETTGSACRTADAWIAAVQRYPLAYGMNEITDTDISLYLTTFCASFPDKPTCVDAKASGYLDEG